MPFQLFESEDADMAETFEVFTDVLQPQALFWHLFPHNDTPAGKKIGAERLLAEKHDVHSRFVKVVDTTTGEIAGSAVWLVFDDERLPEDFFELQGDIWDTQEIKEQAQYAVRKFSEFRKNAIKNANGKLLVLDILAVAERHQRRGVGRMLVNWGTTLADKLRYGAVVESSKEAVKLYESEGFFTHYWISIKWPKKWAHLEDVKLFWLTRPARGL